MSVKNFTMELFRLKSKVALVTGGTRGIGKAAVEALAEAGADVFVPTFSKVDEDGKLEHEGWGRIVYHQTDLSVEANIGPAVEACMATFGRIDILVNNAGTIKRHPILDFPAEDWHSVLDLNLSTVFFMSQKVASVMKTQGGGKIINIASMLSFQGGKFVPSYTASKHGVAGLTKAFANELGAFNIQTNGLAPGYILTDNTKGLQEDEKRFEEILNRIPAGRWGEPSDLQGALVFLASRASDYVNGHILAVDGGWLVR